MKQFLYIVWLTLKGIPIVILFFLGILGLVLVDSGYRVYCNLFNKKERYNEWNKYFDEYL